MIKPFYSILILSISLFACTENSALEYNSTENTNDQAEEQYYPIKEESEELEGSQTDMNLQAEKNIVNAREELNRVFDAILMEYKGEKTLIKNLKISQKLWTNYMEAQMLTRFPEDEESREYSAFDLCWFTYREELIHNRIKELQVWLDGIPEGDVCSGTVKLVERK